jgi:hypothetical protein
VTVNVVAEMTDKRDGGTTEKSEDPRDLIQFKMYRYMRDNIADIKRLLSVRDGRTWNMQDAAEEACAKAVEDYLMALRAAVTRTRKGR